MRTFRGEKFVSFYDQDSSAVFSDLEFQNCEFVSSSISIASKPALRSTIRNATLVNCRVNACSLDPAIVENVTLDGLGMYPKDILQTWGAVFNHVVLRGKIDRLMISNDVLPDLSLNPGYQEDVVWAFREANAEYYRHVDWALDISGGEFKELDIRGVPGHLIRRDPETQILLTRERVLQEDWRALPFQETLTPFSLDFMLQQEMSDLVLVAPKRHRKFSEHLHDLELLRKAGFAEVD
jgi:hypothetical protein